MNRSRSRIRSCSRSRRIPNTRSSPKEGSLLPGYVDGSVYHGGLTSCVLEGEGQAVDHALGRNRRRMRMR